MTKHPAPYNPALIPIFADILTKYGLDTGRICDPFAGSGRIFQLRRYCPELDIIAYELEPEWAAMTRGVQVCDALNPRARVGRGVPRHPPRRPADPLPD